MRESMYVLLGMVIMALFVTITFDQHYCECKTTKVMEGK